MSCCELTDLVAAAAEGLLLCLLIKVHSTYFGLFAFGLFRLVSAYSLSQTTIESIEIGRNQPAFFSSRTGTRNKLAFCGHFLVKKSVSAFGCLRFKYVYAHLFIRRRIFGTAVSCFFQ